MLVKYLHTSPFQENKRASKSETGTVFVIFWYRVRGMYSEYLLMKQ